MLSLFELTKCPRESVRSAIARVSYRAVTADTARARHSLFRAPKEPERLQQWARNIKRGDKTLDDACVVCERHFEPSFIERTFKIVIQGKVEEIPRDVPLLVKEAVPTIFPDAPKYLSKPLPQKRKERNLCEQASRPRPPPAKRQRRDADAVACKHVELGERQAGSSVFLECAELQVAPPWTKVHFRDARDSITFAECHKSDDGSLDIIHVGRRVVLDFSGAEDGPVRAFVYIRGKKFQEEKLQSVIEVQELLKNVANYNLCPGSGLKPQSKSFATFNGHYYAANCAVVSESMCIACKYLRKLTQNTISRRKKKASSSTSRKMLASKTCAVWLMKKKTAKLQKEVEQMKADIQQLSTTEFEKRIRGLPCKQQLAVRTCFEAAKRRSTKGMQYADEWLIECILMRMRSPRLYEHIRRHNILTLPGRTCLQKRIMNFRTGFGFNPNIFSALAEKTKHMDSFSCHGGIVFDEMKLSEHLDVKSNGKFLSGTYTLMLQRRASLA